MTSELTNGFPQEIRARGFSILQMSYATGFIVGPFIGCMLKSYTLLKPYLMLLGSCLYSCLIGSSEKVPGDIPTR